MATNLPAVREAQSLVIPQDQLEIMMEQAKKMITAGVLPKCIDTPEKAIIVAQHGRELGLGWQAALQNIYPIKGNTMLSAKLTEAQLQRHGYRVIPMLVSAAVARYKFVSPQADEFVYEVTWEEAEEAKWNMAYDSKSGKSFEKPAWKGMAGRKIMLANRCITQGAKMFAAGALLYPPTDEDNSFAVYDAEDAEYVSEAEMAHRQESRRRDNAVVVDRPHGRLFARTGPGDVGYRPGNGEPAEEAVEAEFTVPEEPPDIAATFDPTPEPSGAATPVVLPDMPEQQEPHWIDAPDVRTRFWARATGKGKDSLRLNTDQVYDALSLSRLHDFKGTYEEACKLVDAYAEKCRKGQQAAKSGQAEMRL